MNRDDIICMAVEAGFLRFNSGRFSEQEAIERFASLVAATEREACAKLCIEMGTEPMDWQPSTLAVRPEHFAVAQAIRARGVQ